MSLEHAEPMCDWQDYGLGFSCSSLALGCDCLGHIKYFPAVLNTNQGRSVSPPSCLCLQLLAFLMPGYVNWP